MRYENMRGKETVEGVEKVETRTPGLATLYQARTPMASNSNSTGARLTAIA